MADGYLSRFARWVSGKSSKADATQKFYTQAVIDAAYERGRRDERLELNRSYDDEDTEDEVFAADLDRLIAKKMALSSKRPEAECLAELRTSSVSRYDNGTEDDDASDAAFADDLDRLLEKKAALSSKRPEPEEDEQEKPNPYIDSWRPPRQEGS